MRRPLEGIRVVDFTWWRAGPWGGRILSLLGADVIKVEWPQMPLAYYRDRVTQRGMPDGIEATLNNSTFFSENTVGKRSVTINLRAPKGLEAIKKLVSVSDVVLENFAAGILARRGMTYADMTALKPDIIYVSMAGLGHTGRLHEYKTFGPVVHALSGMTQMAGLPGKEPAVWRWAYMDDTGGMYAALCTLAALHHRSVTGQGQHVDLAQVSAAMRLTGAAWLDYTVNGRSSQRDGFPAGNRMHEPGTPLLNNYHGPIVAPHNAYRCAPGDTNGHNAWCTIACFDDAEWQRLADTIGEDWAWSERFATNAGRLAHQGELDAFIEGWTRRFDKYAVMQRCQSASVHAMPVQDARDRVENDQQLQARGLLQELQHAVIGPFRYQRLPFRGSAMDLELHAPGPLAGEHNVPVLCDLLGLSREEVCQGYRDGTFWPKDAPLEPYLETGLQAPPAKFSSADTAQSGPPPTHMPASTSALHGLRILEIGELKGEWAAKLLGELGADVIKVEPPEGSATRQVGPFYADVPDPDRSLTFWHHNTSKRGITLDIETDTGKAQLRELVRDADVVVESFPPGYLASRELDYATLSAFNRRLIMCSVSSFGQTGPWRDYRAGDLAHQAAGGQMAICGYDEEDEPEAPPISLGAGQAWLMGGHYAAIAILAALHQRDVTGIGQHLDVSVHEACALTTEGHLPRYLATGDVSERNRKKRPIAKSQFRCRDGNYLNSQWSSEMTPEHLTILAYWLDDYGMAGDLLDEVWQDQAYIRANTAHIAARLEAFFQQIDSEEAFAGAQQRGFAFGPVRAMNSIVGDPHWEDRGFYVTVAHPELDRSFVYPGAYALFGATPLHVGRRAPLLGEHNAEILGPLRAGDHLAVEALA
jgi:benzylsuccinate CoA-transferase BbsE subunit